VKRTLDSAEVAAEGRHEEGLVEGRVGGGRAGFAETRRDVVEAVDVEGLGWVERRLRRHGDGVGGW
jgi:hypothetical protein